MKEKLIVYILFKNADIKKYDIVCDESFKDYGECLEALLKIAEHNHGLIHKYYYRVIKN